MNERYHRPALVADATMIVGCVILGTCVPSWWHAAFVVFVFEVLFGLVLRQYAPEPGMRADYLVYQLGVGLITFGLMSLVALDLSADEHLVVGFQVLGLMVVSLLVSIAFGMAEFWFGDEEE